MAVKQSLAPEQWVDQHGETLYRYALMRLRDPSAAEELVQETLLAALQSANRFAGQRMGKRRAIQVGVEIPRGEVGIVVAQIGIALVAVSAAVYGVVLAMAVLTTLAAPPSSSSLSRAERPRRPPRLSTTPSSQKR